MMADPVHTTNDSCHNIRLYLALAAVSLLSAAPLQSRAAAEDDMLQRAVNYVFTGRIDPLDGPAIVDRKSCVVVVPDPQFKRYIRYYLIRFKMDESRISKLYSGSKVSYELEVGGDDIIVEYLKIDKTTIDFGLKSVHISLPGNIDQTEKALHLIFSEYCKPEKPKTPF
jgi:hypothetical protein